MTRIQIGLLILLFLAAFFIRIYRIDRVPAGFYIDEADYGLQARSLIQTFKDYRGELSPFWVHSFNDVRTPIPAYFTAVTTLIFDKEELQVRGASAILGTLVVLMVFLLVRLWTENFTAAFLTSAVFAFSPWQIQFSRFSHEGMSMMFIFLTSIYFFYKSLATKSYKFLLLSTVFLSFSVYAYRTMGLFVPLIFLIIFVLYRRELFEFGFKKLIFLPVLAVLIVLPFLYATTIGAPDQPRIAQLSISSDPETSIWVNINRAVDSGVYTNPKLGTKAESSSFFFHSKPLSWLDSFANNYFQTFSTDFLFIKGDRNFRHSVGQMGHLYFVDILAIIFGFIYLVKNFSKKKELQLICLLLLISPIPTSLTLDGAQHAARLFIFSGPLLLVAGFGWWNLFETVKKIKYSKLVLLSIAFLWILFFIFYLHRYFVHFPVESARYFGYGFREAMLKISELESNYKRIAMVSTKDPPEIYYLFWSKTDPRLIQEYGVSFSQSIQKNQPLDKYRIVNWPAGVGSDQEVARYLRSDTLYLVTPHEFRHELRNEAKPPEGLKVIDVILYPDREPAFYLISRDPDYKDPKTPPRFRDIRYL